MRAVTASATGFTALLDNDAVVSWGYWEPQPVTPLQLCAGLAELTCSWLSNVLRALPSLDRCLLARTASCERANMDDAVWTVVFRVALLVLAIPHFNVKPLPPRPPLLESWFEIHLFFSSSQHAAHITRCDACPWLSFFIESRLWQFETVPTFVEGTDVRRLDNEYAALVFRLFADRSPRLERISYHMINTMSGPLQIGQPPRIFTHFALLELNFTPYTAGALFCTCRDMKNKIYTFLHDRELLHAVHASHRNLRDDRERVQAAYPWFVRQRMPDRLRSILMEREHVYCLTRTVPTLALQSLQLRTFQLPAASANRRSENALAVAAHTKAWLYDQWEKGEYFDDQACYQTSSTSNM